MTIKRVAKHRDCLKFLTNADTKLRKAIIDACDKDLVYCICECIQNVLKANVPVPLKTVERLKPYKNTMFKVVNKRINVRQKKKLLNQNGGFLPILLAPLLGIIGTLVGDVIAKNA